MFARLAVAVVITLLCGSYAHAGLIVRGLSEADQVEAPQPESSAMAGWLVSQQEGVDRDGYLQVPESGLAAVPPQLSMGGGANAALLCSASLPEDSGLSWHVSIGNSALPPIPLLDGLLKPA